MIANKVLLNGLMMIWVDFIFISGLSQRSVFTYLPNPDSKREAAEMGSWNVETPLTSISSKQK